MGYDWTIASWFENPALWEPHLPEVLRETTSIPGSSQWTTERLVNVCKAGAATSLLAVAPEQCLSGFALAYRAPYLDPFLYPEECLILRRLFVAPRFRRRGLAVALLREVADKATASRIGWHTDQANVGGLQFFDALELAAAGKASRGRHVDHVYWVEKSVILRHIDSQQR